MNAVNDRSTPFQTHWFQVYDLPNAINKILYFNKAIHRWVYDSVNIWNLLWWSSLSPSLSNGLLHLNTCIYASKCYMEKNRFPLFTSLGFHRFSKSIPICQHRSYQIEWNSFEGSSGVSKHFLMNRKRIGRLFI